MGRVVAGGVVTLSVILRLGIGSSWSRKRLSGFRATFNLLDAEPCPVVSCLRGQITARPRWMSGISPLVVLSRRRELTRNLGVAYTFSRVGWHDRDTRYDFFSVLAFSSRNYSTDSAGEMTRTVGG